jgi:Ring finger domain
MEADECPICTEPLSGTLATLGCCGKVLHVECFVKCMKVKLDCPMCRARHDNLRMVQDVESQVLVPVAVEYRNKNVFRELFTFTLVTSVITLSCLYYR